MPLGGEGEVRGRVGSKGWAVDHQPGTNVDEHSHQDYQKRDLQESKRGGSLRKGTGSGQKRGAKGEDWLAERYS